MRESRLPQVRGSRFVQVHDWAVAAVGLAGAAVLGVLDFLDRNQGRPHRPVATRVDLCAALQGIVGRDAVDRALRDLVRLNWIHRTSHRRRDNPAEQFKFALHADAIGKYLSVEKGQTEFRTAPSGISDALQTDGQSNPISLVEAEGEPPQEMLCPTGGGGFSSHESHASHPMANKVQLVGVGIQHVHSGILPELNVYVEGLNLGESTSKRVYELVSNLPSDRQVDLLAVARQKLDGARDVAAYLMTLARNANEGSLTKVGVNITESNINAQANELMSEAEIAKQIRGKTIVLKGDQTIAQVMNDGLYQGGFRFAVSRASRIVRAVAAGELTMR